MLMRALLVHVAHEIAGAARIRHSLRPLIFERARSFLQSSGISSREIAKVCVPSSPRNGKAVVAGGASAASLEG
jgi:hypothetical protein